jgi:hypothetical protein
MVNLYNKIKSAISSKKPIQFEPSSAGDELARYGFRQLMMNEQLENRVAMIICLKDLIQKVYSATTDKEKLNAIDEALPIILMISQAWGRSKQVWMTFSAQFRELRSMPAFADTLAEEFIDMLNHGWAPQDIVTPTPIIMQVIAPGRAPIDMGVFERATQKQVETTSPEYVEE